MAENSKIEWTDHTFNGWIGCERVSPGCQHCYAETVAKTYGLAEWGPGRTRNRTSAKYWRQPYKWNERADRTGVPELVFCSSMADIADAAVPDEWRDEVFELIGMTPALRWLLLTKRPDDMLRYVRDYIERHGGRNTCVPPNIWWGYTAEDQMYFDKRTPVMATLKNIVSRPGMDEPILWVSAEPLLGPIKLGDWARYIDWVIGGGESGVGARPMHPAWPIGLAQQCALHGIPYFFKQWGEWLPQHQVMEHPEFKLNRLDTHAFQDGTVTHRVGKKASGHVLNGMRYAEYPAGIVRGVGA